MDEPYRAQRARLMCRACDYQGTVTAGTVFAKDAHAAAQLVCGSVVCDESEARCQCVGIAACPRPGQLSNGLAMLHRLRRAMVRPARERLSGKVEVDETYVGGPGRGLGRKNTIHMRHWRNDTSKAIVVVAVEVHEPKGFGRIRMRRVPQASGKYLLPFVSETIAPGSLVHTDGLPIYQSLPERGYRHERSVITGSESPAHVSMPGVHRVASLLKRWLLGAHQGAVQAR